MSAPALLPRVMSITKGADFSFKFAIDPAVPLSGSTASFDLIPYGPAQPQTSTAVPLNSAGGNLVYSSVDNSWTVIIPAATTATIAAGSYRAWLYVQKNNESKLIPVVSDVRVLPSGVSP